MKVQILVGLSASGKSTYAKNLVETEGYFRINRDDFRKSLIITSLKEYWKGNKDYRNHIETIVTEMMNASLKSAVLQKLNVVVDNTHLQPKYITAIINMCKENCGNEGFELFIKKFDTTLEECVSRDMNREDSVGEEVIKNQFVQFKKIKYSLQNTWNLYKPYNFEPLYFDSSKPKVILCDIDGTVAHMVGRSPFDESRVGEDLPKQSVIDIVKKCTDDKQWKLIFVSGRKDSCDIDTSLWIEKHLQIPFNEVQLHMRKHDDNRRDDIIKYEILKDNILPHYNPVAVFDDRIGPTRMWRKMGLTVFQVDEGNF